jgi:hypothetical protein
MLPGGRTHRKRNELIRALHEWKTGSEAPVDQDGNPEPLRVLILRLQNDPDSRAVGTWACNAKMDHVERADVILRKCYDYANEAAMSGEAMIFMLYPLFGQDQVGGSISFPIQIVPDPKFAGSDQFTGSLGMDYRVPANRDATAFREQTGLVREAWGLVGGTMRITIESLERQLDKAQNRIAELEADRERTWSIQQKLMDHQLDRELKYRKENVQLALMEAAGAKVLSYIPVLMKSVDEWAFKKAGIKNNSDQEPDEAKELIKLLLSKFDNKEKAKKIFDAMNLSESEAMKITNMGKELHLEEQRQKLVEESNAAIKGLPSAVPIRRLSSNGQG